MLGKKFYLHPELAPGMSYNFLYKRLRIHQHVQVVCIYQKVFCFHQDGIMLLKIRINI